MSADEDKGDERPSGERPAPSSPSRRGRVRFVVTDDPVADRPKGAFHTADRDLDQVESATIEEASVFETRHPARDHARSVWSPRTPRAMLPRRRRVAVLALLLVLLGVAAVVVTTAAVERRLRVELVASEGSARVQLNPRDPRPVSPGCGCLDPTFGAHSWFGMNLPSAGFELDVKTATRGSRFGVEAYAPSLGFIDWFEVPDHSLGVVVRRRRQGHTDTLFSGRALHVVVLTKGTVRVRHGGRYPYAALLPADASTTGFRSEAGSRPDFGSTLSVDSAVPARSNAYDFFDIGDEEDYVKRRDLTQRGTMVDVLGPEISFDTRVSSGHRLYVGALPVRGVRRGDEISVTMRTPFALRLAPHPADAQWAAALPGRWAKQLAEARRGDKRAAEAAEVGRRFQGRFVQTQPTPAHRVRLLDIAVPSDERWKRFARLSSNHGEVPAMLSNSAFDGTLSTVYRLPPVGPRPEVGVFGAIGSFESNAVSGSVASGSLDDQIVRGQQLSIGSEQGLDSGRFAMTPLVSAGPDTRRTALAGRARVEIDGHAITKIPALPWIIAGIAVTLLALLVEGLVRWGFGDARPRSG